MKTLRILVLTDAATHSAENSMYAIVNALAKHNMVSDIFIASRHQAENKAFFLGDFETIHAMKHFEGFDYELDQSHFRDYSVEINTNGFDLIFMRLPRPITDDFLRRLEIHFTDSVFINSPTGIIKTSNKGYLLQIQDLCPPVKRVKTIADIKSFAKEFDIVLKPLRNYGGKGILKVEGHQIDTGNETYSIEQYFSKFPSELDQNGYIAMKFLKNVHMGDKRLIYIDGEIVAASLRLPAKGSWLCNVARGGSSRASAAGISEQVMVKKLKPYLEKEGIFMAGIDTLVDDDGIRVISEINTLSIGGIKQADANTTQDILGFIANKMVKYTYDQIG